MVRGPTNGVRQRLSGKTAVYFVKKERETEMYLCGEEYNKDYEMSTDYLFDSILKFFGIKRLRKAHSGDLSSYLYWLVLGTILVILMLVIM